MMRECETEDRPTGTVVDHNVFAGSWPFRFLGEAATPISLEGELRSAGVASAWLSPFDALFNAEPYSANDWLLGETAGRPFLQPVPILHPLLSGAGRELERICRIHPEIPAIRLAPGYHGYDLSDPRVGRFLGQAPPEKPILLTLRLQDRRGQLHQFQVPDVPLEAAFTLADQFPGHRFLLCGVRLGEVASNRDKWQHSPNLHLETSFLDNISGIAECAGIVGEERLHLGSLAPLLYAAASVNKIRTSGLPRQRIEEILSSHL